MALRIPCLLLFAIIALAGTGHSAEVDNALEINFQKVTHEADVRHLLQYYMPEIRRGIIRRGMDPLELASFSECILPLPGILKGKINFKNGWLQQLSTIQYAKQATMTYSDKRLVLDFTFVWDSLDFNYEYDFRYLLVTRRGDINGRLQNAEIRIVVSLDLLTYNISLEKLQFVNIGKYTLRLEGHLLDPIFNAAAKVVTTFFKDRLVRMIEERAVLLTHVALEDLNNSFPRPQDKLL